MTQGLRVRVIISSEEEAELNDLIKSRATPNGLVIRANIILQAGKRIKAKEIAATLNIGHGVVTRWTHRWEECREREEPCLSRLMDMPRSGRNSDITPEQLCQLVALACEKPDKHDRPITHWTQRELTDEALKQGIFDAISVRHVGRLLKALDLKPHKSQYWLNAKTDPDKEEKIATICQAYDEAVEKKR